MKPTSPYHGSGTAASASASCEPWPQRSHQLRSLEIEASEPGPVWIMPVAGTFMRGRHALKPAGTARRRRRTGAMASRCQRSFADRDTGPCDLLRGNLPAWVSNVPDSSTTHPRIRLHRADARPNCRALPGARASPTWGRIGKNLRFGELREDGYLQPRPAASAGFYIQLPERRLEHGAALATFRRPDRIRNFNSEFRSHSPGPCGRRTTMDIRSRGLQLAARDR